MIDKLRTMVSGNRPDLYAVLDIGTTDAKALLVLVEGDRVGIVGAGRCAHSAGAMAGASLADAKSAAYACEQALAQAEAQTETIVGERLVADKAVLGISGPELSAFCRSLEIHRAHPQEALSESELKSAVQRAERAVLQQARDGLAQKLGQADIEIGLVDADILHLAVDGEHIVNSVALKGAIIDVRLSNVFAPKSYLASVSALANVLELEPAAILCGACAVARTPQIEARGDAIIIDVGGDCTDVLLVRQGGIESIRTVLLGGAAITRRVARTLGVPQAGAEEVKRSYGAGKLEPGRSAELRTAIAGDIVAWLDGVQAALKEMAGREEGLPAQVFLCGGGAALADVQHAVRSHRWIQVLPFDRQPQVTMVQSAMQSTVVDLAHTTGSVSFAVPAAMAAWAEQSIRRSAGGAPQRILKQALHGMGLY